MMWMVMAAVDVDSALAHLRAQVGSAGPPVWPEPSFGGPVAAVSEWTGVSVMPPMTGAASLVDSGSRSATSIVRWARSCTARRRSLQVRDRGWTLFVPSGMPTKRSWRPSR